ncbi:MAG: Glucose-6-phosphate 1-dehydrogenase [Candidatus Saccharibacteria bacterium]|nr:Glucose-6-phosphate 1-dehydrogenase [Candidatus Saccharibacteria bacterium]
MKTKLIIFGITGDLSTRKLLPALSALIKTGDYDDVEIIGVSRREVNVAELLQSSIGEQTLAARTRIFSMDLARASDYGLLREYVALKDDEQLIVYLSVPPSATSQIVDFMGEAGINTLQTKLLFEKPFGVDLASAEEMIARTARYYNEDQIYRIDHYLAKEMSQNIVAFRGGNALFTHIWDNQAIEKIEIIASEQIGIEGRAGFYEQTGALRDVLQGHLMQLLALTLMDIPDELDWSKLPELRLEALQAVRPADPRRATRAQYIGYQTEVGNPGSVTETYTAVELISSAPQWKDVPLHLITGKALDHKTTEVRIHFRKRHEAQSNCLTFSIQPNEGVSIELFTKKPGYDREFESRQLAFTYPEDTILPDAYEQVLVDAIRSHKSLFTSSEEVLASWKILQPILDAWQMESEPLQQYAVGSDAYTLS